MGAGARTLARGRHGSTARTTRESAPAHRGHGAVPGPWTSSPRTSPAPSSLSPGSPANGPGPTVRRRRRLAPGETQLLGRVFDHFPKPSTAIRTQLASQLNMAPRAVQIWFQNRRAKAKRDAANGQRDAPSAADTGSCMCGEDHSAPAASERNVSRTPPAEQPCQPHLDPSVLDTALLTPWLDGLSVAVAGDRCAPPPPSCGLGSLGRESSGLDHLLEDLQRVSSLFSDLVAGPSDAADGDVLDRLLRTAGAGPALA
jgi:hypothetical protein